MDTTTGYAWEVKHRAGENYSVRHRRESGAWETPHDGGWDGRHAAVHALYCSGVSEATANQMLDLAANGGIVRLENGGIRVLRSGD